MQISQTEVSRKGKNSLQGFQFFLETDNKIILLNQSKYMNLYLSEKTILSTDVDARSLLYPSTQHLRYYYNENNKRTLIKIKIHLPAEASAWLPRFYSKSHVTC